MLDGYPWLWLSLISIVALTSAASVAWVRRLTLHHQILDVPNARSSHAQPVPRGGGIVIVVFTLFAWIMLGVFTAVQFESVLPTLGAVAVAAISFVEDATGSVSVTVRAAVHAIAAGLALIGLSLQAEIWLPLLGPFPITLVLLPVLFLCIVGLTNVYNFMDGIDGIAGGQAVVAGVGWCILGQLAGSMEIAVTGAVIAAASLGFLYHNWSPACIFMGDVGSTFLGFVLAVLCICSANFDSRLPFCGVLLVWPFVFDGLLCLFRRAIRGEAIWKPHRMHLYQRLVDSGWSHQAVSLLYIGLSSVGLGLSVFYFSASAESSLATDAVVIASVAIQAFALVALVHLQEKRFHRLEGPSDSMASSTSHAAGK